MEKNVRLIYLGRIRKIRAAVRKSNEILSNPEFYDQIKCYRKFNDSNLTPEEIITLMQENKHEINIQVSAWSIFFKARAQSPNKIVLSFWNFGKNLPADVNKLVHETVNAVNFQSSYSAPKKFYNKRAAAPWIIGAIAEVMVK